MNRYDDIMKLNKKEYGAWLTARYNELNFSFREIAEAAGVSATTIGRYMRGETAPDSRGKDAIYQFINEFCTYENHYRIPNEEFSELLSSLISEFGVSQQEIADAVNLSQPCISDFSHVDKCKNINAEVQHKILSYFLNLAKGGGVYILPEYKETGEKISRQLNNARITRKPTFEEFLANGDYLFYTPQENDPVAASIREDRELKTEAFKSLPSEVKRLITENEQAFFFVDRAQPVYKCSYILNSFRTLDSGGRALVLKELEGGNAISYYPDKNRSLCNLMVQFHRIIGEAPLISAYMQNENNSCGDTEADLKFSRIIRELPYFNRVCQNELQFRLEMSESDWYIIMLVAAYYHKGNNLEHLYTMIDYLSENNGTYIINAESKDNTVPL